VELALKNLVVIGLRGGEEAEFRLTNSGVRYNVDVLKDMYNLCFLSLGEETAWDAYELPDPR
jgi:hypothetical protein